MLKKETDEKHIIFTREKAPNRHKSAVIHPLNIRLIIALHLLEVNYIFQQISSV